MPVNISSEVLSWLLVPDDPGPRYLALRDLLARPSDDPELLAARAAAHAAPPIATILDRMEPEGFWGKPGAGYGPKYSSSVWALITLAQVGATAAADERIRRGATYLLDHSLGPHGQLTTNSKGAPSGTVDCLQGNLLMSLMDLGIDDPRLDLAFEWMARTVTGEGMAPKEDKKAARRYYAYKSGPLFRCGVNGDLPCGWGAAKVMLAFAKLPPDRHTPLIDEAVRQGTEYLLGIDPATAGYPSYYGEGPSRNWWEIRLPGVLHYRHPAGGRGAGGPRLRRRPAVGQRAGPGTGQGRCTGPLAAGVRLRAQDGGGDGFWSQGAAEQVGDDSSAADIAIVPR
jgi:hypothetical protein